MSKIFINYRRDDAKAPAGRLYDRLEAVFGPEQLFFDVDHIAAGQDFVKVLDDQVGSCAAMLSFVGPGWLDARDGDGRRRLDDPDDFVRLEIEAALTRGILLIPVLLDNTPMPREDELPESLAGFARRNATRLTHERFRSDMDGLVTLLQQEVGRPEREAASRRRAMTRRAALWAMGGAGLAGAGATTAIYWTEVEAALFDASLRTFSLSQSQVRGVAFHPDGERALMGGGYDGQISLWSLASGMLERRLFGPEGYIWNLAISPDGRHAVSSSDRLVLHDLSQEDPLRILQDVETEDGQKRGWWGAAFTPDGRGLAAGEDNGIRPTALTFWEVESGRQLWRVAAHDNTVYSVAVTPNGRRIITGGGDSALRVWDAANGKLLQEIKAHRGGVSALALTPDGRRVLACDTGDYPAPGQTRLWDLESAEMLLALPDAVGAFTSLAIAPDGRRALLGASDGVKLWDLEQNRELTRLPGHAQTVWSLSIGPDGERFVSGSMDGTMKLWELPQD